MAYPFESIAAEAGIPLWLFIIASIWSIIWKALAWWKSARLNHKIWFISFFVFHTLGILEILYLFLFSKISLKPKKNKRRK